MGLPWKNVSGESLVGLQKAVFEELSCKSMTGPELGEKFKDQLRELYEALGELELRGFIRRNMDLSYAAGGSGCAGGAG